MVSCYRQIHELSVLGDNPDFIGELETSMIKGISSITLGYSATWDLTFCISDLKFTNHNMLPDTCGFPMNYLTGNVIYFEGTCENPSTEGALCTPTTTDPNDITTKIQTTKPKTVPQKPVTDSIKPDTDPNDKKQKTGPKKEKTEEPNTPDIGKPLPKTEPPRKTDPKEEGEERKNETEDNEDDHDNNEYDNNTENEDDADNVGAATGGKDEKNNQSLITIIAVVVGGVVLVVILLYVGYKFHFRDKGSYKLDDNRPDPDDYQNMNSNVNNGNDYVKFNATGKDQEWYL